MFHQICRDVQAVKETADEELRLSTEYGFQLWIAVMLIFQGWVLAEQGRPKEGIAQIRLGLEATKATGNRCWHIHHLTMLAEAYVKAGQMEDGLVTLEESR